MLTGLFHQTDLTWAALQPRLLAHDLPIDDQSRWMMVTAIAGASAKSERIAEVRAYGVKDMPAEARRPAESAVGSIRLNQATRARAIPDIVRWIAAH